MQSLRARAGTKEIFCMNRSRMEASMNIRYWRGVDNGRTRLLWAEKNRGRVINTGKSCSRGLVRLHKLRPQYKLAELQCRLFRSVFFASKIRRAYSNRDKNTNADSRSPSSLTRSKSRRGVDFIPQFVPLTEDTSTRCNRNSVTLPKIPGRRRSPYETLQ